MSYNKNTWETGDTVTAAKLNNMENGITANDKFFITSVIYDEDGGVYEIQNTWQELYDAMEAGKIIYCIKHNIEDNNDEYSLDIIICVGFYNEENYIVILRNMVRDNNESFEATSASSKPTMPNEQ